MKLRALAILAVGSMAAAALAQPVVDGTRAGDSYGAALAVQTIETSFGDNQSEWNAAYGKIEGGKLYLMFTGNVEGNFNKLEIFIDSVAGGSNVMPSLPGNDGAGIMGGMTFDTAFQPEYHMIARRGFAGTNKFDLDFAELGGIGTFSSYQSLFGDAQEGAALTGTGQNAGPIGVAYDNSNVAGIGGTAGNAADQVAAAAVETGLELSIDLADINYTGGPLKVMLLQNNDSHDFLSNQTLGGLPVGFGNLGNPASGVDFSSFAGDQYFIVPEPTTLALLGIAGLFAIRRRR